MNTDITIAQWKKTDREVVRVKLCTYKGKARVDCREWYKANDGSFKPGRAGLSVPIRDLPTWAEALAKTVKTANASGLMPADDF